MDFEFGYLGVFIGQIPTLLVLLAGIILLAVRRQSMPGKAFGVGVAGLVLLGLCALLSAAWTIYLPQLYRDNGYSEVAPVLIGTGLMFALLNALGLGLLIAAILIRGPKPAQSYGGFGSPVQQAPPGYAAPQQPAASPPDLTA